MYKKRELGMIKSYKLSDFIKLLAGCFLFLAIILYFYFFGVSPANSDNIAFSPGQIILGKTGEDHRIFIQKEKGGYYVVQDIGADGMPLTNPYRIKNKEDLINNHSKQNSIDGLYVTYDRSRPNGERLYRNYHKGLEDGLVFSTYENGNIKRRASYRNGRMVSNIFYFRNGKKRIELSSINNETESKITVWWDNGAKRYEQEAKKGEFDYQKSWYKNGTKRAELYEKHGKGYGISWHEDGKKSSELEIVNSEVIKCSGYDDNGEIILEEEISCNEVKLVNYRYPFRESFDEMDFSDNTE